MQYRLAFRRYALPFRTPVRTAYGLWSTREGIVVRLESEGEVFGYGEAAPIPFFGTETVDQVEAILRELGSEPSAEEIEAAPGQCECLRAAFEMAALIRSNVPSDDSAVSEKPSSPPPSQQTLPVAALLPAGKAVLDQIEPKLELGFRTFKWKVGVGEVGDELVLLDDVLARLPSGAKLRLDANGAWDRRKAQRWLERCADRPIEFIEQPIAADMRGAMDLLMGLANDYPTPLGLDESLVNGGDIERWLGSGWPGVYILKLSLLGDAKKLLAKLALAKSSVVFSSALETGLGARRALEQAFAWPGTPRALGFGMYPLFQDARFDGPFHAPFFRKSDIERINPESIWNALS